MCGRYALSKMADELIEEFEITAGFKGPLLPVDWNIAPTKEIYIVRKNQKSEQELATVSWGLIAPWSKDRNEAVKSQSRAINARTESVHEKPTFKNAFRSRRCLIPATGYYEWATELGPYETKQPFFIHHKNSDRSLAFAGIYDRWIDENGEFIESAAIITRPAVGFLATVHHRMPTFLPHERISEWLDPKLTDLQQIRSLLDIADPAVNLIADPVSKKVNQTRNNGIELSTLIELDHEATLF